MPHDHSLQHDLPYRRIGFAADPADIHRQVVFTIRVRGEFDQLAADVYTTLDSELGRGSYTKLVEIPLVRVVAMHVHEPHDVATLIETMALNSAVACAEQNRTLRLTATSEAVTTVDGPLSSRHWALPKIGADAAWQRATSAGAVTVAIVDTGINVTHPDLRGHLWTGATGHHGWNVIDDSGDVGDLDGHGTLLAGTIGAVSNRATASPAAARPIRLMAVKFRDERHPPDALTGLLGIVWAATRQARVIVLAWDLPARSLVLEAAIAVLNGPGFEVLFVAGAGNDGVDNDACDRCADGVLPPTYPASAPLDNVVSVMASDEEDDRPAFSNYGLSTVHLAAPGIRILSTHPYLTSAEWMEYGGTSAACAHVASAAALLRALNSAWKPKQVREHLIASADSSRWLACEARGRLSLARAVCGPLTIASPAAGTVWPRNTDVTVTWDRTYETPRCTSVRVLLSRDGGTTYGVLSSGHANTGRCVVRAPNRAIANARLKLVSEQGPGLWNESEVFQVQ
jgi:hypothetical protein